LKTPEPGTWQRTSPLAILFFLGKLLRDIVKNAWQSFAPLLAFLYAAGGSIMDRLAMGGAAFALVIIVASALRYWFFRFKLVDDSILIRQGVLKKKQLDIKFDRIQGINTQQNMVYRYLDLVTVSFDTAGSSGDEGNLPAVPREFANSLRERIGRQQNTVNEDGVEIDTPADSLLQLGWRDMIRIGLSDRRVFLVLVVLGPVFERLGEDADNIVVNYIERAPQDALQFGVVTGVTIGIAAVLGVILLLMSVSIAAAFLRYHNFELFLDESTLRSQGGLLTRHEVSMDLGKIQTLRLQQGIVRRMFNRFHMSARQARASHKNTSSKNFTIPIVTAELANTLRRRFLKLEGKGLVQIPTSNRFVSLSPYYMRTRLLFVSLLPTLVGVTFLWQVVGPVSLTVLLWAPISSLFIYLSWKRGGYLCTNEGLVRRRGMIGYRTVALLYRKVQRVTVTQSRYQRRKDLASVRVYMASGSVRVPYIGHETANQLRDYILYKVESSRQAWH